MPKYKVLEKSFINNSIVEAGEIVEYQGQPGNNLELLKAPKLSKGEKPKDDEKSLTE